MRHNILHLALLVIVASCGNTPAPESNPADTASDSPSEKAAPAPETDSSSVGQEKGQRGSPNSSPEPELSRPNASSSAPGTQNPGATSWVQAASEGAWQAGLASKVQVVVREEGQGAAVKAGDMITVHYHGLIFNGGQRGAVFDSSRDRGQSVSFPIGKGMLIPGWDKVLPGFKIGSKLTLMIPPELAYGNQDKGVIKPNSTLLFEIDILSATTPPEAPSFPKIADNDPRWQKQPSGLMILTLREGSGAKPTAQSMVKVHYSGWLSNGTPFDNSYERGSPFEFPVGVGQVIPGWDEGIMALKKGSKALLRIPPELAYGPTGAGNGAIPPNATLVFQVELLE